MKRILVFSFFVCFFMSCSDDEKFYTEIEESTDIETQRIAADAVLQEPTTIWPRSLIDAELQKTLDRGQLVTWGTYPSSMLYSAAMHTDQLIAVGYQPAGYRGLKSNMHKIDVRSSVWQEAAQKIYSTALTKERLVRGSRLSTNDIVETPPKTLPYVILKISHPETIEALKQLSEVRYIEPLGYELTSLSSSSDEDSGVLGCGDEEILQYANGNITLTGFYDWMPWNYNEHNIPQAWATLSQNGISKGGDITTAIIDTGVSDYQYLLGSGFSGTGMCDFYSSSRTINKYSTLTNGDDLDTPHDQCGHGTRMAGIIGAPSRCDETIRGVAYECNIDSYRATRDVYIAGSKEKAGVSNAIIAAAGNNSDVRIISMSIGRVFKVGIIEDAIVYAKNQGLLIFCAAGTSSSVTNFTGVVFPANMDETVGVTGIRQHNSYNDDSDYSNCSTCHKGKKVVFTGVIQRENNNTQTASLTRGIEHPAAAVAIETGGSSAATATVAGIATLVWGADPSLTNNEVLDIMIDAAALSDNKDNKYGYGVIDANAAVTAAIP